jgi:hypothetical protein
MSTKGLYFRTGAYKSVHNVKKKHSCKISSEKIIELADFQSQTENEFTLSKPLCTKLLF